MRINFKEFIAKYKKWSLIYKIFVPLSSTIFVLWLFGILMQFAYISIVDNNYDILFQYGQISLTVFGFSLIGGIFEKKNHSDIEVKLFETSISFLITSISFFYLYAIIPVYLREGVFVMYSFNERLIFCSIFIAMLLAFTGIITGFTTLLQYLIAYRNDMDK
jgi:hypothetical protein